MATNIVTRKRSAAGTVVHENGFSGGGDGDGNAPPEATARGDTAEQTVPTFDARAERCRMIGRAEDNVRRARAW